MAGAGYDESKKDDATKMAAVLQVHLVELKQYAEQKDSDINKREGAAKLAVLIEAAISTLSSKDKTSQEKANAAEQIIKAIHESKVAIFGSEELAGPGWWSRMTKGNPKEIKTADAPSKKVSIKNVYTKLQSLIANKGELDLLSTNLRFKAEVDRGAPKAKPPAHPGAGSA